MLRLQAQRKLRNPRKKKHALPGNPGVGDSPEVGRTQGLWAPSQKPEGHIQVVR